MRRSLHALAAVLVLWCAPALAQVEGDFSLGGGIRIGDSTTACAPAIGGAIRCDSDSGKVIAWCNGTAWTNLSAGGTPAGANAQIQFNSDGAFGASANLLWDTINTRLGIGVAAPSSLLHIGDGDLRIDGTTGNQAGCFRYDDAADKLQYSNDCAAFWDMGSCVPEGGGETWTPRAATEANSWTSVAYGNGLFVAVSQNGTNGVMTSSDGITWTPRAAAEANAWISVAYGNGLFVAVSLDGTNRVMTSPDGITWTPRAPARLDPASTMRPNSPSKACPRRSPKSCARWA